jgi:hypothetical protein
MPSVKCELDSCYYRGKRGACKRKQIALVVVDADMNELHCLGWIIPPSRLLSDVMKAGSEETKNG